MENPIVAFKKPANQTNVDLRVKLALYAEEMLELKEITSSIIDEEEYQVVVFSLIFFSSSLWGLR